MDELLVIKFLQINVSDYNYHIFTFYSAYYMKNTILIEKQWKSNILHGFDKAKITQDLADILPNIPKERLQKMIKTIERQIDNKGEIRGVPLQEILENAAIPDTYEWIHQRLEKAAEILWISKSDIFSAENADIKNAILEMHAIGSTKDIHGNPISENQKKYIFEFSKEELIAKRNIWLELSHGKLTKLQIQILMDHGIVWYMWITIWIFLVYMLLYGAYKIFNFLENKKSKKSTENLCRDIIEELNKYKQILSWSTQIEARKILLEIEIVLHSKDPIELCKRYLDVKSKISAFIWGNYKNTYDTTSYTTMNSLTNTYKILWVTPQDDFQTIKKAYRRLAIEKHPDKVDSQSEEVKKKSKEEFQKLNDAYAEIKKANNWK